jgi:hypothetical protein
MVLATLEACRIRYTGQQTLPFGDKIRAVPLDALWRVAA